MPRIDITAVQPVTTAGLNPTFDSANASGGQMFANNSRRVLRVKNGSASSITVTVGIPGMFDGVGVVNGGKQITVPASGDMLIGPFGSTTYNQPDGKVYVDFSAAASVTLAVLEVPQV